MADLSNMKLSNGLLCHTYLLCELLYNTFPLTLTKFDDVITANNHWKILEKKLTLLVHLWFSLKLYSSILILGLCLFTRHKF